MQHPYPRAQILKDLTTLIHKWIAIKYDIILMWDSNEGISKSTSKLHHFMNKNNLSPIHHTFLNATYARGTQCIDFIMATPAIHTAAIHSGYLPFYNGIWNSDHRGVFVDINTTTLFQEHLPSLHTTIPRHINSNNKKQVFRFITSLDHDPTSTPTHLQTPTPDGRHPQKV
jgi:hypothetical protein